MNLTPEQIIIEPALTEKSEFLKQDGKYVFFVSPMANRIEVAEAIEAIFNRGKKKDKIKVAKVNIINVKGKATSRQRFRKAGKRPDRKKAIITLAPGQELEGIGA